MPRAESRNWYDKYAFQIFIGGIARAAFTTCSELVGRADKIEHREGGDLVANNSPGLVNFEDLTLERGETADADEYAWWTTIFNVTSGCGAANEANYKRDIVIMQRNRACQTVRRWIVYACWPIEYSPGDWDNSASEKKIERIVLANEGFEMG